MTDKLDMLDVVHGLWILRYDFVRLSDHDLCKLDTDEVDDVFEFLPFRKLSRVDLYWLGDSEELLEPELRSLLLHYGALCTLFVLTVVSVYAVVDALPARVHEL